MARPIRLDHRGVEQVAKSGEVAKMVEGLAERVAANVRKQGHKTSSGADLPVEVTAYTTDRAAASVAIAHPSGLAHQAKYGALTKAAADAGLEVREK